MIPKLIHITWFSGEPYPESIKYMMSTWKKKMPEYEIKLWDMNALLNEVNIPFATEAASVRKWAFAADVTRLFAVYKYGGIWLDTDVEIFKSLDAYLDNEVFIGREANMHNRPRERWLTAHCFGAVAEHPYIKECLDYYVNRRFIQAVNANYPEELRYDMRILPEVMAVVALRRGYDWSGLRDSEEILDEGIHVYPSDYFDSPRYNSMKNVVAIHRALGGWRPGNQNVSPDYSASDSKTKDLRYYGRKVSDFLERRGYAFERLPKLRSFENERK